MPELASLDAVDIATCFISVVVVMRRASWLQHSVFLREVQNTTEDFPFDSSKLFVGNTGESLHTLKDSGANLYFLGIYTPAHTGNI